MQQDIQELRNLPLEDLITAPLNAVIKAQNNAAMTTVAFIESVGLIAKGSNNGFLDNDDPDAQAEYDVRMAKMKVEKTTANGTESVDVEFPFVSMFNVPTFEINNLEWEFNAKLKSVQSFSAALTTSASIKTETTGKGQFNLNKLVKLDTSMKVETAFKTDFEMRYKADREQEYNLKIKVNASAAPPPKGLAKLLDIIEKVAASEPQASGN